MQLYPSKSFEELAREKRYQFFEAVCNIYKTNKVITAHHYFEDLQDHIDAEVLAFLWDKEYFEIPDFNNLSNFLQKEVIRYIYYISNNKSTIGLSQSNINEIIRFINGKNNKTIKEIRGLQMRKDNKIIIFKNT